MGALDHVYHFILEASLAGGVAEMESYAVRDYPEAGDITEQLLSEPLVSTSIIIATIIIITMSYSVVVFSTL